MSEGGRARPASPAHAPAARTPFGGPGLDRALVSHLLQLACYREEGVLLESEGMALLEAIGIAVPRRIEVPDSASAAELEDPPLAGDRVVIKVVAPKVLHKTEARGVSIVPNCLSAIVGELQAMERRFERVEVAGFLVCEYVPYQASLGHEYLLGLRWTRDFGPVVTLGPGGVHAEYLARALRDGEGLAVCSPASAHPDRMAQAIARLVPARLVTERRRGREPEIPLEALTQAVCRFLTLADEFCPDPLTEFEANPVVVSGGRLVALDALGKLRTPGDSPSAQHAAHGIPPLPRPLDKIHRLLEPRSIAVVGVSEKMNPGRVILQNILRAGFDPAQVVVVKPGAQSIDGCRCHPSLAALPEPVDLVVLSVAASQAAGMIAEIASQHRAESVVLIPGGLEEKPGAEEIVGHMRRSLLESRLAEWRGPVVNGGNCLGIRSVPGRYNTLFIPEHKLPTPGGPPDPVALITGSGAFAVSKGSKLAGLNPLFTITVGNQMDLTVADYLTHLADDARIELFALYIEGFRMLDGWRFVQAIERIVADGRDVIVYLAGRTDAGAAAAASHTAAVAGDHLVARRLSEAAGAIVAETLDDFEDLVRLFTHLRGRRANGPQLGAVSNAGFECVAIADNLGAFELATWAPSTVEKLHAILERAHLSEIVSVRNPMDLTPILGDADYEAVVRTMLEDPGVDAGLVGCVPLTGALNTLASGIAHADDVAREDSVARRLVRLRDEMRKPWVAVVDSGPLYDPMVRVLENGGVPTFRTADRAMRLFGMWCAARLRRPTTSVG